MRCAPDFEDTNTAEMHASKDKFSRTPPMLPLALTGEGECREAAAFAVVAATACSVGGCGGGSRNSGGQR